MVNLASSSKDEAKNILLVLLPYLSVTLIFLLLQPRLVGSIFFAMLSTLDMIIGISTVGMELGYREEK